ncbi:hypothetical protein Poly30_34730 [Planctomycetes bacterium Poly30]|uniref:Uncharacterized protein n=1 Tax=Saltatorellus ferox TaxID=2528018 RepID=A0A518EV20_9BACT|nr:hypothetical protein Poly30_34730 [Planctomycetes bacterium Poly30]
MLRLLAFFVAVIFFTRFLATLPIIGAIFRIPFLGFWFTAILLSAIFAKLGSDAVDYRARRNLEKSLGAVDTPHHKGKLGALLLAQGRARRAIPLFEEAAVGDPTSLEWRHKLGMARLQAKDDPAAALAAFDSVLEEDVDYGFGSAMLLSAEAAKEAGFPDHALDRVQRFEREHGPTPLSALLRAELLKAAGDRAGANAALDEIPRLAKHAPKNAQSQSWSLRIRALMLRLLP